MSKLAIYGGTPVCQSHNWPKWPPVSNGSVDIVDDVATGHRWTIRGYYTGKPSTQVRFSTQFAAFNKARYCTLTSSGSTALLVALEAANIGAHDEVILPVYTWIASAIAILNVNAIPVFVDVDPDTGCINPNAVEAAITPRTRAVMPVHLHCAVADMVRLRTIADRHNLLLVEDCAQAHGAQLHQKPVGTWGDISAFSFNQEKVLCCGEGGAIITNDEALFQRAVQSHADGARYPDPGTTPKVGQYELIDDGDPMGSNYCMSDFQAAVLLNELQYLEDRNRQREHNAQYLTAQLEELSGVKHTPTTPGTTKRTYFRYAIRLEPEAFSRVPTARLGEALSAELGFLVSQTECEPLHRNPLYNPLSKKRYHLSNEYIKSIDVKERRFPVAEAHFDTTLVFHHSVLLANQNDMDYIAEAFAKVQTYSEEL